MRRRLRVLGWSLFLLGLFFGVRLLFSPPVSSPPRSLKLPPGMTSADVALAQTVSPDPPAPLWQAASENYVYMPTEKPRVWVSGKPGTSVSVSLFRVDIHRWLKQNYTFETQSPVATATARLAQSRYDYNSSTTLKLPRQKAGAYVAVVRGGELNGGTQRLLLLVTNIGIVAKTTPSGELIVQATRLDNGQPVTGCKIEVEQNGSGPLQTGVTDADGFYTQPLAAKALPKVLGTRGANVALCFALDNSDSVTRYPIFFQTDRPVYKPGDTASFKGVLREDTGKGYKTLADTKVDVEIQSPEETTLTKMSLKTNSFGSFSGEVKLPEGSPLGSYPVILRTAGGREEREEIVLAEYRKPEFKATVKPVKAVTLVGEAFAADVEATYYFGAPVVGAEVRYYVYAKPDYIRLDAEEDDGGSSDFPGVGPGGEREGDEYGGYGEMIAEGTVITSTAGTARISLPTRKEPVPVQYVVECHLSDASRQNVNAKGSGSVLPSALYVEATPEKWGVSPGEAVPVAINTVDSLTKKPLATPVVVTVERRTWERVLRSDKSYRWRENAVSVLKTTLKTGADGNTQFMFTPSRSGDYRVRTTVVDAKKRRMEAERDVWVYGAKDVLNEGSYETVEIKPDKRRYRPGDTAKVLLRTSSPDVDVWFTVEGKKLYASRRLHIEGNARVVSIPLPSDYAPGVYVSASYVKNKQLLRQEAMLPVSPREHLLNVSVASDKAQYQPGETAQYTVNTTDLSGKPVSAEVAVGVVDASLYAVRADNTPDIRRFFWSPGSNSVGTAFSFASQYAGGPPKEAMTLSIADPAAKKKLRTVFKDSAFWSPSVVTDSSGRATIRVPLPDNLTTWRTTARAVTRDTAVGWRTHDALSRRNLIARLATPRFLTQGDRATISGIIHNFTGQAITTKVTLKAQGPGVALAENGVERTITIAPGEDKRLDWPVTGALPGTTDLTLEADAGIDNDGMVLSLPTLPRGVVKTVASSGQITAKGISKTITIPEGRIAFRDDLKVMIAPSLLSAAIGGGEDLAKYPYGCIEQTLSRFVPNLVLEKLLNERKIQSPQSKELPKMAQAGLARVYEQQNAEGGWAFSRADTDPYFTAIAVEALTLAQESGYAVNERVRQRGVSALRKSISSLLISLPKPPKRGRRPWEKEETRYRIATNLHNKARALYALSLVEPKTTVVPVANLWKRRAELDTVSVSYLVKAAVQNGSAFVASQGAAVLRKRAVVAGERVFWRSSPEFKYLEQDTYATAEVLRALLAVAPNDPLIPKGFRFLMAQRKGRSWHSTNDTAAILYAVTENERAHPTKNSAVSGARIMVNGETVQEVRFTPADLLKPETVVTLDPALLHPGNNTVSVQPVGAGEGSYYALGLRYFLPTPPGSAVQRVVSGVRVERTYLKRIAKVKPKVGPRKDSDPYFDYWSEDNWKLVPFGGKAQSGDEIVVKLVVSTPVTIGYVLIEDLFPAGCEPATQVDADSGYDGSGYDQGAIWGRRETHHDRICYLGEQLQKGKTVLTFRLRATTPGVFTAPPARVFAMYVPEIYGSAASAPLAITDPVQQQSPPKPRRAAAVIAASVSGGSRR